MTATSLPDSARTIPSLPRSLYLDAQDRPHWSKVEDSVEGKRKASSRRNVEITRRRQMLAAIHDSLHHLRAAATAVGNLDRNGLTLAAADNMQLSLEHTAASIELLVADMRLAAANYATAEVAASRPSPVDAEGQWGYWCAEHDFRTRERAAADDHEAVHEDAEELAEREADDLEAAADARAADQVVTALSARTAAATAVHLTPADVARIAKRTAGTWS